MKKSDFFNHFFQKAQTYPFEASTVSEKKIRRKKQNAYIGNLRLGEFFNAQTKPELILQRLFLSNPKKVAILAFSGKVAIFWPQNGHFFEILPISNKKRFFATVFFIR